MTAPQVRAFAVTLVFSDGRIYGNTVLAPLPEAATAMAMQEAMRASEPPGDLNGFAITELRAEWMRATLPLIEGERGQVVSLVSDNLRPANSLSVRFPTGPVGGEPA